MTEFDTSIYKTPPAKSAVEQLNDMIGMQNSMQDLQAKRLTMAMGQQKYISNVLGTLYSKPDLSADDIIREGSKAVQMGILPQAQFGTMLEGLPQDQQGLRQWVGQAALRAASASEQLEAFAGKQGVINTGAHQVFTRTSPMNGNVEYSGGGARSIPNQISPTDALGRTSTIDPETKAPISVPSVGLAAKAGVLTNTGAVDVASPVQPQNKLTGAPMGAAGAAALNKLGVRPPALTPLTQAPTPILGPHQRGTSMAGPRPVAPSPSGLAASANSALPTALAPGQATAMNSSAEASARQGNDLQNEADKAQQMKGLLADLERHAKEVATGPGSGALRTIGGYVNQGAALLGQPPLVQGQGAREELAKTASKIQALGGTSISGTDAGLALAAASNPNENYTREGLLGMTATLKGQADMTTIKNQAWQEFKKQNGPEKFGDFQQQFQKDYSPRVFQIPYMTPDAAKKMLSDLTPEERSKVVSAYNQAYAKGWVAKPGEGK